MATERCSWEINIDESEEDFIEMEVSTCTIKLSHKQPSLCSSHHTDFEFQMCSKRSADIIEHTASPADELFYKGKLLPHQIPPRSSKANRLLKNSTTSMVNGHRAGAFRNLSFARDGNKMSEASKNSPSEPHRIRVGVDHPDDLRRSSSWNDDKYKKSLSRKIKQSQLALKLKSSKAYLKSLFTKSTSSHPSTAATKSSSEKQQFSTDKEPSCVRISVANKCLPYGQIQSDKHHRVLATQTTCNIDNIGVILKNVRPSQQRRSFSGAIRCSLTPNPSCPANSSSLKNLKLRIRNESSEIEKSIQGAIAHCKQSQAQQFQSISSKVPFDKDI